MKIKEILLTSFLLLVGVLSINAQKYHYIKGFSKEVNQQLESFLNQSMTKEGRKVAVFDCDGTLMGEAPHYLVDEAMYSYAKENYEGKTDSLSIAKMRLIKAILSQEGGVDEYKRNITRFFSGMTTQQMMNVGWKCYHEKYANRVFPEMCEVVNNMQEFGIEVWVVTASPELLYQRFVHEELGIPEDRIIGIRTRISKDIVTEDVIDPMPHKATKVDAIETFIKARPIFSCGNSMGDYAMLHYSSDMRMVVNPNPKRKVKELEGQTLLQYWSKQPNTIIVNCDDVATQQDWIAPKYGKKKNPDYRKEE